MAKIILQNVRCSYVYADKQRKNKEDGSPGGYGVQLIIEKKDPQVKKLQLLVRKVLGEAKGADALKKLGMYKLPVRDGDEERDGEEYNGTVFANANSGKKPGIVNRNNEPADQGDIEELCYSGAYFHVSVNVYFFKAKDGGKPGVALGLNNVMLRKKGERLDGSVSATSEFEGFEEADDEFGDDEFDDL